jgi:protease-4
MKDFFKTFFASILAVITIALVVLIIVLVVTSKKEKIRDHSYLVIDIYGDVFEYDPSPDIMSELMGAKPLTLQMILSNLEKASVDERIEGVIMKLNGYNNLGYAKCEEIRGAIKKVQKAGKKVYAFSDSIDKKTYFIAAACDKIYMPANAYVILEGFATAVPYIKGTLDKLGIKADLHKIKDYKSAAEMVIRKDMSPEARENRKWLMEDTWEIFIKSLQEDRGLTEEKIIEIMNQAMFMPEKAKEFDLIDEILYWDEIAARLKQEKDEELRTVSQSRYDEVKPKKLGLKGKKKIAVVHAQGLIAGRESDVDIILGVIMGHETVNADLRRARKDKDVAAVIFRVDSGGGSGLTSDLISRGIDITSKVKPVVVSMVDVAGSGGYWISYKANKIVANPTTRTGSIGSISGKFNMKGFYDKIGITYDFVTKGPNALILSDYRDFTKEEREIFERTHWDDFNAWLRDVAQRRGMTFEEAEKLAHGRVWTGRQAKANGLIDEVGGLDRAIEMAKELAKIPSDEKVTIVHYPKKKSLVEMIFNGEEGITTVARWMIFHFIHEDLAETWNTMTSGQLYLAEDVNIN